MNRETDWIRAALDRTPGKTQSGLAQALGIDKSSVSRLLRGERRLKFVEARIAADYLGVEPPAGFTEESTEFEPFDRAGAQPLAPLFRATAGPDEFWRLDRTTVVERKVRAPQLYGAAAAFGFYAPDNAMAPRFKIGEIAWVNPARPAAPGDDALLTSESGDQGLKVILLCELQQLSEGRYRVRQHSCTDDREFDRSAWRALYVYPRA